LKERINEIERRMVKIVKIILLISILLNVGIIWTANVIINKSTNSLVYGDPVKIPHNKVGLLLGTSKYLRSGMPNQYFINRLKATVELYSAGKIDFIVISGDNSEKYYNEPRDMKNELVKLGVPENKIFLDYAGFRTFDSIIRIWKIFGQTSFTVISQDFHNRRAIYIAKCKKLHAIGYNAADVNAYNGFKTKLREKFARVKVFIDLMSNKEPKFLGQTIDIK
jgi:SanA protein